MNKFLTAFCLGIILSVSALAQTNAEEYKKNEYYVGYSNQQVTDFRGQAGNGAEAAYVRNVSRYIGIKGDFSATFQKNSFRSEFTNPNGTTQVFNLENKNYRYNFLGGIQIKDNASKARFKPFVHALAGVAVTRSQFQSPTLVCSGSSCTPSEISTFKFTRTNFSAAIGGGLDIKVNDRIDFRAFQVDYNPTFSRSYRENSIRLGVGIVFK